MPMQYQVKQLKLGKNVPVFEDCGDFLLDAHNQKVSAPVWDLYKELQQMKPGIATQIEWDNQIPALEVLMDEADKAQRIMDWAINL